MTTKTIETLEAEYAVAHAKGVAAEKAEAVARVEMKDARAAAWDAWNDLEAARAALATAEAAKGERV